LAVTARTKNLILTGIPRAGTTLAAAMIDSAADSVCLNEPLWQHEWAARHHHHKSAADFAAWLADDFARLRALLAAGGTVMDRRAEGGAALTNYAMLLPSGERVMAGEVAFSRPGLSGDMTLAVKHNGLFMGVLPQLLAAEDFTILAVIRHPAEVLASWRRTPVPVARGQFPAACFYWREMADLVARPLPLLEKQVRMLDLLYARLWELRARLHLIRYEELIGEPRLLSDILGKPVRFDPARIEPRAAEFEPEITDATLRYGEMWRYFYSF
jgi:hypothetical protein